MQPSNYIAVSKDIYTHLQQGNTVARINMYFQDIV